MTKVEQQDAATFFRFSVQPCHHGYPLNECVPCQRDHVLDLLNEERAKPEPVASADLSEVDSYDLIDEVRKRMR